MKKKQKNNVFTTNHIRKKICFVTPRIWHYFKPSCDFTGGGAERQIFLLSNELSKDKKFDVNICSADYGQNDIEKCGNISIWKSFSYKENKARGFFKLTKILKRIQADVYIFRAADIGVFFAIFWLKLFFRKKCIYMVAHDDEINFQRLTQLIGFIPASFMNFTFKLADKITVQSDYQYDEIYEQRRIDPDSIIRNIYRLALNENEIDVSKKNTILWVGKIDYFKRAELFLELARNYPAEKFIMIAPVDRGKESYWEKIKSSAQEIINLEFIGQVASDKILNYFREAKIYVITSESEGFSNTMLEAMDAKCALLTFKVNPDNIIDKHHIGLCAEGNVRRFFDNFETLLFDHELRNKCVTKARYYIEKYHSPKEIVEVFKTLL